MDAIGWTQTLDSLSLPGAVGGAAVALTLSVVLWLFGAKLLRPLCGLTGLALGAASGWLVHRMAGMDTGLWVWMLIGAVVSGTAAVLMFRMWMGLSLGLLLLVTAPVVVLAWHDVAPPRLVPVDQQQTPPQQASPQQANGDDLPIADLLPDGVREQVNQTLREQAGKLGEKLGEAVEQTVVDATAGARHWSKRQADAITTWWDQQDSVMVGMMATGAMIGGAVGLALGLLMPKTAAAVASGILAVVLGLAGVQSLMLQFKPAWYESMLTHPRAVMLSLLILAMLGITWQAFSLRRADDKS